MEIGGLEGARSAGRGGQTVKRGKGLEGALPEGARSKRRTKVDWTVKRGKGWAILAWGETKCHARGGSGIEAPSGG